MSQECDISLDVEAVEREALGASKESTTGHRVPHSGLPQSGPRPVLDLEVPSVVPVVDVDRFYADVLHELQLLASAGGTATGAAAVVKRVALAHGVPLAAVLPLPRLNRAEQAQYGRRGVSRARARRGVA